MVLTLHLNVLYWPLPCTTLTDWFCVTELDSVYCAVRTESLHKTDTFRRCTVNRLICVTEIQCIFL